MVEQRLMQVLLKANLSEIRVFVHSLNFEFHKIDSLPKQSLLSQVLQIQQFFARRTFWNDLLFAFGMF